MFELHFSSTDQYSSRVDFMSTVLLTETQLPAFQHFSIADFQPALESLIDEYNALLAEVCRHDTPTWEASIAPLSDVSRRIDHIWSLLSHFKAVDDSDEIRDAYRLLSAKLTEFRSDVSQNAGLFKVYESIRASTQDLPDEQAKVVDDALRDFRLSGVALPKEQQSEFKRITNELVRLSNLFSENVLDASEAWSLYLEDAERLDGVPDSVLQRLAERAASKGHDQGYLLGLDITLYLPLMQHCKDRTLREEIYRAFTTRASAQGIHDEKLANEQVMKEIMCLRQRKAKLLNLASYGHLSVLSKMAESPEAVLGFLQELLEKAKPLAEQDFKAVQKYALEALAIDDVKAWDVAFVSEAMRRAQYDIDHEALRSYFPLPVVLNGLFAIATRLFGVSFEVVDSIEKPVSGTQCVRVFREEKTLAYMYLDLYAREGKRGGAWVAPCQKLTAAGTESELRPVAFLVCNFPSPSSSGSGPSLLSHTEMVTLFHEFGHALHHCLTRVDEPEVSGISGVPWDAVELPSQFLENWCWEPEALAFLSQHVETGEALPKGIIDKLLAAKTFQSGMMTVRQIEFALFDFRLHCEYEESNTDIQALLEAVQSEVAVVPVPEYARFANSFSHIFAGGYAAGYYSYKWAEVLSADAFSAFQDEGVFNAETGARFKREILERGGVADVNDMFMAFRGRMPSAEPLLKQMGA